MPVNAMRCVSPLVLETDSVAAFGRRVFGWNVTSVVV